MLKVDFELGAKELECRQLARWGRTKGGLDFTLAADIRDRIEGFRGQVEKVLNSDERVYGINTGFGFLADVAIAPEKLVELQENLVRSHACGVGNPLPDSIVRALLILRAHTFSLGHSGVRPVVVEQVLSFLRHDILPVIPCQGSVGASGDLAPLAHLAMGLMGEGKVKLDGKVMPAPEALAAKGLQPLELAAKEGLALINGTHLMTTYGAFMVEEAERISQAADVVTALSLDATRGSMKAYDPRIHAVRQQRGQQTVAANMRKMFAEHDEVMESHTDCDRVQDPYSFRCAPQVHGASRDAIEYVRGVVNIELNSVTDNPIVFENGDVISGGNFHGQPVALALDFLGMAVSELGSISERRVEKITNPNLSGLPAFATKDSGLNSGLMIPHVVAAALASENKILCHPASVDSIPTSADKEDHVSMGPIAARKANRICKNVRRILAIELIAASQGLFLLEPLKPSAPLQKILNKLRDLSPPMERDRSLHEDIESVNLWIRDGGLHQTVAAAGIELA